MVENPGTRSSTGLVLSRCFRLSKLNITKMNTKILAYGKSKENHLNMGHLINKKAAVNG